MGLSYRPITYNGKLIATINPPLNQKTLAKKQLQDLAANAVLHDVMSPVEKP